MSTPYTTGTVSVTAGSFTAIGDGTAWETSGLVPGVLGVDGLTGPVATIVSDNELTMSVPWSGPTASGKAYWITYDTTNGQQTVGLMQKIVEYFARLNSSALAAISGVMPVANSLLLFTSANTATTISLDSIVPEIKSDVEVATLADRAAHDGSPSGFKVLVSDIGDGRSAIYSKASATSGDWGPPAYITGANGEPGPPGPATQIVAGDVTTLAPGSAATVTEREVIPGLVALDFGLPAGPDGTGTGSVTSIAMSVPTGFNVAGSPVTTSGTFAVTYATGYRGYTNAENTKLAGIADGAQVNIPVGTTAGTVAAGDDVRFSQGGSSQNEAIFALEIADLKGSRLGMKGGVADAFDDETGVDVKANAVYDAANDWYTPTSSASVRLTGATPTGLVNTPANINDNNTATTGTYTGGDLSSAAINSRKLAQLDLGSVQTITKIEAVGYYQSVGGNSLSGLYYSLDGVAWTQLGSNLTVTTTPTTSSATASVSARYVALILGAGNFTTANVILQDLNVYGAGSYNNMTLVSVAYPLPSVPANGRIVLQTVEFDTAVANTDFVAEFSRDNGTTWTAGTLALSPYLAVGNYKMYEAQSFSVASQPSGGAMKWRARTLTNKNIAISGIVSQGA